MYVTLPVAFEGGENGVRLPPRAVQTAPAHLKPGACLFREGDQVNRLYQVLSGVVRLARVLEDGRRQVVSFGYPGDLVGFPNAGLHHSDCEALTEARLQPYRIALLEDGEGDPGLHRILLQHALREMSALQDHLMMLGRKSAVEKLSSFLFVLLHRPGNEAQISLPMSRADIADFLGLTTETVSRVFTQLRKRGVIGFKGTQNLIVLKPDDLEALARGFA
jgi:CRP-like cAMP-binding protein